MTDSSDSQPKTVARHGTDKVTTDGSIAHSDDPSTSPDATTSQKLKGDIAGAWHGTVGSIQAATGTMLRNKNMQEKGMEKMSEEDHRIAAKHGVPPVGNHYRETRADRTEPTKE